MAKNYYKEEEEIDLFVRLGGALGRTVGNIHITKYDTLATMFLKAAANSPAFKDVTYETLPHYYFSFKGNVLAYDDLFFDKLSNDLIENNGKLSLTNISPTEARIKEQPKVIDNGLFKSYSSLTTAVKKVRLLMVHTRN